MGLTGRDEIGAAAATTLSGSGQVHCECAAAHRSRFQEAARSSNCEASQIRVAFSSMAWKDRLQFTG